MKNFVFFLLTGLIFICSPSSADEYIIDNDDGPPEYTSSGDWHLSSNTGYNGGQYWYVYEDEGPTSATWTPNIQTADLYEVYAIFRRASDRSLSVPYTIHHASGTTVINVDQTGSFVMDSVLLGEYYFNAGTSGYVRLDNTGSEGVHISDTFRFLTAVDDAPIISDIEQSPTYPQVGESVLITAGISDDRGIVSATLEYTASPSGLNNAIPMADDGASGDGAAGDGIYGALVPAITDGETVSYFISAQDNGGLITTSPSDNYTVGEEAPREYRCIWADSWNASFLNQSQAQDLVNTCRDNNINTIIIEVRKIGDAYYDSNIEPRATNITGGPSFDPLGYLIDLAHDTSGGKEYIHVHAWFVMHRISKGETLDPQHVLVQHPEYVMLDSVGNDSGGGNNYLDPGHPGTVDHNVAVIIDCLSNYDIDGINLDYIRYPEASGEWGYNPVSIARFNAFTGKTGQPAGSDLDWDEWRRRCVTNEVKKILVKSWMVKSHVVLTADTINWGYSYTDATYPSSSAYAGVFQDWVGWLEEGIIDYNALMNYTDTPHRYEGWTNLSLAHDDSRGSIIGIGAYLQSSVQDSMDQLLYARQQGAAGLNIYDWGSEASGSSSESRADFYNALSSQVFTEWVDPPTAEWKANPTAGIFEGNLTNEGIPVDHAEVMIEGNPDSTVHTDGSGWFAILNVPPGQHNLVFSKPGYSDMTVYSGIPSAGDIVTVNADFSNQSGIIELY